MKIIKNTNLNKIIIISLIPFFIFFICFLYAIIFMYYESNVSFIEQTDELIDIIYQNVSIENEIDFDDIINFKWDEILIIQPYQDPKLIFKDENIEWKELRTSININDSINLIVFLLDREIIAYVNYPRVKGDFQDGGIYTKKYAKFQVERSSSDEWIYIKYLKN